ncbi:DUF2635 domain-containing protein [Caulobacter soli]|uniref:DUF2635 domain-containing protein n=1 Tax=Caulobacter soli TaxID=2708539 RepID=UPI0013EDDF84|nr:DUF2635 domain-containing protein [Caulobacter soli]
MAPRLSSAAPALPNPIPVGHPVLVAPAAGRRVRDPAAGYQVVPDEGKAVAWSTHWARLKADDDITVGPVLPAAAETSEA